MEVKDLLNSWELSELIPIFDENLIDIRTFQRLSPEMIRELIPNIGLRLKFVEKYGHYKQNSNESETSNVSEQEDIALDIIEEVFIKPYITDSHSSINSPSTSSSSSVDESVSSGDNPNMPCIRQHATLGLTSVELVNTPYHKYNAECAKKSGLEDVLNSTTRGKLILHSYQRNSRLLPEFRNKLVELLLDAELEDDMNKKISILRFEELASAIVGLFPTEYLEVYFRKTKKRMGGYVGGGKLFSKYYNMRKQLKLNGFIKSKYSNLDDEELTGKEREYEEDENITEAFEWLKHNSAPQLQVEIRWRQTLQKRRAILKQAPIHEYLNTFPMLQANFGYNMFNIDFEELYKENDIFYLKWNGFSTKILAYAKANKKDKTVIRLVEEIESGILSEDGKNNRLLKMLPYLVTPVSVTRKWKPSKSEIEESFIMHVKVLDDLKANIETRRRKLENLKLPFQPMPIIIGADLDNIETCYVRVDNFLYKVESPLKAVEVTFKTIHALHALYPCEAEQVWLLIQRGLFNLKTQFDKQFVSVNLILPHLE